MNYADLFRVTLPETVLEVAALLVLVVDLGFLRKAALQLRLAVAAIVGIAGCGAASGKLSPTRRCPRCARRPLRPLASIASPAPRTR